MQKFITFVNKYTFRTQRLQWIKFYIVDVKVVDR